MITRFLRYYVTIDDTFRETKKYQASPSYIIFLFSIIMNTKLKPVESKPKNSTDVFNISKLRTCLFEICLFNGKFENTSFQEIIHTENFMWIFL